MKYYTPDLLARFGSDDLKVAKAARQELEKNADEYIAHLDLIRPKLPPRLVELQERFYLHDARVTPPSFPLPHPEMMMKFPIGLWYEFLPSEMGPRLSAYPVILQLDTPPHEFLVLHYRFVTIEEISRHPALREGPDVPLEWLHDELALVPSGEYLMVEHMILFTNGLELRLRFRDFDYATMTPLNSSYAETPALTAKH